MDPILAGVASSMAWSLIRGGAVKGADLLIHEAYSLQEGAKEAHAFGHSTAAEAGRWRRPATSTPQTSDDVWREE